MRDEPPPELLGPAVGQAEDEVADVVMLPVPDHRLALRPDLLVQLVESLQARGLGLV